MKRIILVLLIPFGLNFIIGCCQCLETMFFEYTNCIIRVDNLNNSGPEPIVNTLDEINKEAFGLRITIERSDDVCLNEKKAFFSSKLYATSCECPPEELFIPKDTLSAIKVKSLMNFDSLNLSGDYITNYFSVLNSTEYISIDEFIQTQQINLMQISNLEFDMMLITPPTNSSEYQFEIEIELSDGRIMKRKSDIIELI